MTRARGRLPDLVLACGAVAACLGAAVVLELALRLGDPRYLDRTRGPYVYSARLGWRLRPGFQGLLHDTWTTVNARGYRGPLHPDEKTPGRTRIVMLGDSITFGHRVGDEETFSALLESRTGRYEVLNLSVEGYGTDQELIQLETAGLGHRPDVVILNFCVHNDVLNNSLPWDDQDGKTPKPWFSLEAGELRLHDEHLRLSRPARVAQWLSDESHLYGRLSRVLLARPEPRPRLVEGAVQDKPTATDLTFYLIRRMATLATGADTRFLVVLHPDEPALRGQRRLPRRLRREPLLAGLPILDLAERYRVRHLEIDALLFDYQGHLRPFGHRAAVQEIETALADLGALVAGSGE